MNKLLFKNRYLLIGFTVLVLFLILYFFTNIVAYILISWILSLLGDPILQFILVKLKFEKIRGGKNLAAALTIMLFFVILTLLFFLFVPLLIQQAQILADIDYNNVLQALEEPIAQFNAFLERFGITTAGSGVATEDFLNTFSNYFKPDQIGNFFTSLLGIASEILLAVFSVVFMTFFFLKDQSLFVNFMLSVVPDNYEGKMHTLLSQIARLLTRYFGGILLQITIITLYVSILLSILGIENAFLIGFFAALINVIPYLGPLLGLIFGVFVTISTNLDVSFYPVLLPMLIKLIVVFATMQLLDNFCIATFHIRQICFSASPRNIYCHFIGEPIRRDSRNDLSHTNIYTDKGDSYGFPERI